MEVVAGLTSSAPTLHCFAFLWDAIAAGPLPPTPEIARVLFHQLLAECPINISQPLAAQWLHNAKIIVAVIHNKAKNGISVLYFTVS